jgi:hypothetical protein
MKHAKGRAAHTVRMPRSRRLTVYLIVGAVWLTGCVWLYLDQFQETHDQFGVTPHPLESPLLLLHGIAAILSMYLFGWISARHILRLWSGGLRRMSGAALAAVLTVLVFSGFALFFLVDDRLQHFTAVIHEVLGLAVTVFAIQHWFYRKPRPL